MKKALVPVEENDGGGVGDLFGLLRHVFTSVAGGHSCHVTVNGWLNFSVRLMTRHHMHGPNSKGDAALGIERFRETMDDPQLGPLTSMLASDLYFNRPATFFNGTFASSLDGTSNDPRRQESILDGEVMLRASLRAYDEKHGPPPVHSSSGFFDSEFTDPIASLLIPQHPRSSSASIASLRPYQTLLLLREGADVIDTLPEDASRQLLALVKQANPLLSFQELSVKTGIPLVQVHRLSAHLTFWGEAKVIDTIVTRNKYRVCSSAPLSPQSSVAKAFADHFRGKQSLTRILSFFSPPEPTLHEILNTKEVPPRAHLTFMYMLVWLLQRGLIEQVHEYVYLFKPIAPPAPPKQLFRGNGGKGEEEAAAGGEKEGDKEDAGTAAVARAQRKKAKKRKQRKRREIEEEEREGGEESEEEEDDDDDDKGDGDSDSNEDSDDSDTDSETERMEDEREAVLEEEEEIRLEILEQMFRSIVQHLLGAAEDLAAASALRYFQEQQEDMASNDGADSVVSAASVAAKRGVPFRGGVRLMELLWRENISRDEFDAVRRVYGDNLRVCWHA